MATWASGAFVVLDVLRRAARRLLVCAIASITGRAGVATVTLHVLRFVAHQLHRTRLREAQVLCKVSGPRTIMQEDLHLLAAGVRKHQVTVSGRVPIIALVVAAAVIAIFDAVTQRATIRRELRGELLLDISVVGQAGAQVMVKMSEIARPRHPNNCAR